jgi:hexosaminidase
MWDRYAKAFDKVWVASAFKGATGPRMFATDISYHAENHKMWLAVVAKYVKPKFKVFRGYAVTGWTR